MIALHYAPGTIASAVAIALAEAGVEFDAIPLDFRAREQTGAAYGAINAKGRVPALVTPRGALTETPAILEWIAAERPGGGLMPGDDWTAAKARELMAYVASTFHVNHAHKHRGHRWADRVESHADMRARVTGNMTECCAFLEATLAFAPHAVGPDFTVADCHLYSACHWLAADDVAIEGYPRLAAWHAMVSDRPSVRTVRDGGFFG